MEYSFEYDFHWDLCVSDWVVSIVNAILAVVKNNRGYMIGRDWDDWVARLGYMTEREKSTYD